MKKTLVALAALAATASFAQSSVQIIGVIDAGIKATAAPTTSGTGNNNASNTLVAASNTATTAIKFVGTEDIGGGIKAGFLAEINQNPVNSTTANQSAAFATDYLGTPFNGEQFLSLSGGFGEVKVGVPNAGFFLVENTSHPFGTAMGSGYAASGFSRLGTTAPGIVSGVNTGTARIIRHERTVQYTTPVMNGFTATVDYAALNDNNSAATSTNLGTSNYDGYTSLSLRYSNGPLNIGYSWANNKFGSNPAPLASGAAYNNVVNAAANSTAANYIGVDYTYSVLAGNYTMGNTTVYAGYTTTKSNGVSYTAASTNVFEDATSYNVAAKYTMGATDLLANYTVRTSNRADTNNARGLGLGADYNLSKRTALYVRYENFDYNTNSQGASVGTTAYSSSSSLSGGATGGSVVQAYAVGIRHAF